MADPCTVGTWVKEDAIWPILCVSTYMHKHGYVGSTCTFPVSFWTHKALPFRAGRPESHPYFCIKFYLCPEKGGYGGGGAKANFGVAVAPTSPPLASCDLCLIVKL